MVMGKKVVKATRVTLGAAPKPIHSTSSGATAIVGMVCVMMIKGYTARYRMVKRSISVAVMKATATPVIRP